MHLKIHILGKVQGVWYRKSTQDQARKLGIFGFVQNEPDGSVYAEVEGPSQKIEAFLSWCEHGPTNAKVLKVHTQNGDMKHFETFEIRR